jgi:hypothetical protein
LQPPETLFPASGSRGGGMIMTTTKRAGTNAAAASMSLADALNILIQGYIKGTFNHPFSL